MYNSTCAEMQGHWSRDDPSFFLLLTTFLAGLYWTIPRSQCGYYFTLCPVSSVILSLWMSLSAWGLVLDLLWAVFADGLLVALIVATVMW